MSLCPHDGGTCHHACAVSKGSPGECFREKHGMTLSGYKPNPLVIYKYNVPSDARFAIELPVNAYVLDVQLQGSEPCIWVLLDPKAEKHLRLFRLFATGQPIEFDAGYELGRHVGTFQTFGGSLVFHLFEIREK